MIGVAEKIWDVLLSKLEEDPSADTSVVEEWAKHNNIWKKDYRGGTLEGNQARQLLRKLLDLVRNLPEKYKVFGEALHRFDDVVTACFGMLVLDDYKTKIAAFKTAYASLGISVTPKVYAVFDHVPEWVLRSEKRTGIKRGLGFASEQASESAHRDICAKWEWGYKVNEAHKNYHKRLLDCVVRYNSRHI